MTYYDILNSAIAAVCENVANTSAVEDYFTRGEFLLASFVTQYARLDGYYRKAHKMEAKAIETDMIAVDPEEDFPLCDVFIPVSVHYVAAGLVIDENEEMSDKFFDRYINGILEIRNAIPAEQGAIVDRYGLT